jgi:hypothetical protein
VTPAQPTDPYADVPTSAVYDTFAETAAQLTAAYTRRSDMAATDEERERWWTAVLRLRDTKRAVPAHDRAQLLAHIQRWEAELTRLKADRG